MYAKLVHTGPRLREIALERLPAIVGRSRQAEIPLPDRWTSRQHCKLDEIDGSLWVFDLDSTHGTYVNGCRVVEALLRPGDRLHVGLSTFTVAYEPHDGPAVG